MIRSALAVDALPPVPDGSPAAVPLLLKDLEVSALIGMSRRWLWQAVSKGTFPAPVRIGRAARWRRAEVEAWVEELR